MPGRILNAGDKTKNLFTGKEQDSETGWDYFGARYYSAALGRWLAVDPLWEMLPNTNPFNYVRNNSINRIDPDGLQDTTGITTGTITITASVYNDDFDRKWETQYSSAVGIFPERISRRRYEEGVRSYMMLLSNAAVGIGTTFGGIPFLPGGHTWNLERGLMAFDKTGKYLRVTKYNRSLLRYYSDDARLAKNHYMRHWKAFGRTAFAVGVVVYIVDYSTSDPGRERWGSTGSFVGSTIGGSVGATGAGLYSGGTAAFWGGTGGALGGGWLGGIIGRWLYDVIYD